MQLAPRRPLFLPVIAAAITLASPLFSTSAHANMVVNGGFEDGASSVLPFGGTAVGGGGTDLINGSLNGWTVGPVPNGTALNVLATNDSSYYGTDIQSGPHSGDLAAVFPNFPNYNGYMAQAISGVVGGSIYQISFWMANQVGDNPNNGITVNWGGIIASPGASITDGTNLMGPVAIPVPLQWTQYSFTVGASSDNALLSFIGGNSSAATLIDDVDVEFVAVPEVSSFGMVMGLGLLALGTAMRVRRRSLVTA